MAWLQRATNDEQRGKRGWPRENKREEKRRKFDG